MLNIDDIGHLLKIAFTGDEKQRNAATRLLAVLPEHYKDIEQMKKSKTKRIDFQKILVSIVCFVVILYFGIKIYKEIAPQSYTEQKMHCLELGSNARATACLRLIKK